jgi:hypothetical protein
MLIEPRAFLLLAFLASPLVAQSRPAPLQLGAPTLAPGVVYGTMIGTSGRDSGFVAKMPRIPATGMASSAIEIDTLDFRPKWTMRIRLAGPDSMEIVLRGADTLPPGAQPYQIIHVGRGISHADPHYLSAEMTVRENGVRRRFLVGGTGDRVTFGQASRGSLEGALAVLGRRLDRESGHDFPWPWRYRGLEARFTTRPAARPALAPELTPASEARMMKDALDGVLMSFYGAVNGDGDLTDRTPAGIRTFVERRWRPAIEVDSVRVTGDSVWLRLRGARFGVRCVHSGHDLHPTCTVPTTRRS